LVEREEHLDLSEEYHTFRNPEVFDVIHNVLAAAVVVVVAVVAAVVAVVAVAVAVDNTFDLGLVDDMTCGLLE
jgi:nucleoside permease NupC